MSLFGKVKKALGGQKAGKAAPQPMYRGGDRAQPQAPVAGMSGGGVGRGAAGGSGASVAGVPVAYQNVGGTPAQGQTLGNDPRFKVTY